MSENQLAKNIIYYRKKRGLTQEKVSEYMGVSRQAVTKWENDVSRPSSDNLIKLAQLFEVSVDALLDNEEQEKVSTQAEISTGKMPWVFIGISVLCIFVYVIYSALSDILSCHAYLSEGPVDLHLGIGTLICMFVLCVPIQLFLHIYFSNAIKNDSFSGIAGFDDKIEYNICEVKKMLVQIDLHVGMMSTVCIFLLCVINCMDLKLEWLNGFLIVVYTLNFIITVEFDNYKMIDKIYRRDDDKKRAKRSIPVTVIYTAVLFVGIGITDLLFEIKGIENNTLPAMKIGGLLLLGVIIATISFILENNKIKKWDPANIDYKISKTSVISVFICVIIYGFMCLV